MRQTSVGSSDSGTGCARLVAGNRVSICSWNPPALPCSVRHASTPARVDVTEYFNDQPGWFAATDGHHDAALSPVLDSLELAEASVVRAGLSVPHPAIPASVTRSVAVMSPDSDKLSDRRKRSLLATGLVTATEASGAPLEDPEEARLAHKDASINERCCRERRRAIALRGSTHSGGSPPM